MSTPDWLDRLGWPYAARWIALPEGRLHHVDEGTGDTVVLGPAGAGCPKEG